MKLYRDIEPGETLQAGDKRLSRDGSDWVPVEAALIGQPVPANLLAWWLRRPVDLPVLQRVTPEAMAELEGREADRVLVLSELGVRQISYAIGNWWVDHPMCRVDRPTTGWFIDLSTIPEVQQ